MRLLNEQRTRRDLLYADGILGVLSASVADQVGAVDPVDELRLRLQPLHGPRKPTARKTTSQFKSNQKHAHIWMCKLTCVLLNAISIIVVTHLD